MKHSSTKLAICAIFVLSYLVVLVPGVRSYPPFLRKAKELGLPANDCSYCHAKASGGQPLGERAKWLVAEKEKRAAAAIDVAWLKEYDAQVKGAAGQLAGQQTSQGQTTGGSTAQSTGAAMSGGPDQALMRISREWADAFVRRDKAALEGILAEDFTSTSATGAVTNKAQYVEGAGSADLAIESIKVEDGKVRLYGESAVVTGSYTLKGKAGGEDISGGHRYTAVYVKRQGRWQPVAFHSSRVTQ